MGCRLLKPLTSPLPSTFQAGLSTADTARLRDHLRPHPISLELGRRPVQVLPKPETGLSALFPNNVLGSVAWREGFALRGVPPLVSACEVSPVSPKLGPPWGVLRTPDLESVWPCLRELCLSLLRSPRQGGSSKPPTQPEWGGTSVGPAEPPGSSAPPDLRKLLLVAGGRHGAAAGESKGPLTRPGRSPPRPLGQEGDCARGAGTFAARGCPDSGSPGSPGSAVRGRGAPP